MNYFNFQGIQFEVEGSGWEAPRTDYYGYWGSTSVYSPYMEEPYGWMNCKIENATQEQIQAIESFGLNMVEEAELIYEDNRFILKQLILKEFSTTHNINNFTLECKFRFKKVELLPELRLIRGFFAQ